MGEIADLHARALHKPSVAIDQCVDFVGERLNFAREFAFEAFRLSAPDLAKCDASLIERPQTVENGKAVDDETPEVVAEDASDAAPEAELNVDNAIAAGEPEFGERIEPTPKKPARGSSKKAVD